MKFFPGINIFIKVSAGPYIKPARKTLLKHPGCALCDSFKTCSLAVFMSILQYIPYGPGETGSVLPVSQRAQIKPYLIRFQVFSAIIKPSVLFINSIPVLFGMPDHGNKRMLTGSFAISKCIPVYHLFFRKRNRLKFQIHNKKPMLSYLYHFLYDKSLIRAK